MPTSRHDWLMTKTVQGLSKRCCLFLPPQNPGTTFEYMSTTSTPPPPSEPIARTSTPDAKSALSCSFGFKFGPTVPKGPTKDLVYYREAGDCIILVGNVLFKVCNLLLSDIGEACTK
jgi:hypothetical protein